MLTVCAGLFLAITKTTNDDVPVGGVLILTVLCDLILGMVSLALLVDSSLALLVIQGLCR